MTFILKDTYIEIPRRLPRKMHKIVLLSTSHAKSWQRRLQNESEQIDLTDIIKPIRCLHDLLSSLTHA